MKQKLVGRIEKLGDIVEEWTELWTNGTPQSPFCHPAWNCAYIRAFAPASEVILLTARSPGQLIGVLPLVRERSLLDGFPVRTLRGLVNAHFHTYEVLFENEHACEEALGVIWQTLRSIGGWDVLELPRMRTLGCADQLRALAQRDGYPAAQGSGIASLFVPIEPRSGLAADLPWQGTATHGLIRELRRTKKRAESDLNGCLTLETITSPQPQELRNFYKLESAGWKGRERTAISSAPETLQFYDEIARAFSTSQQFALHFLRANQTVLAASFDLVIHDRLYILKLAHDERLRKYGPGHLLIDALLHECWERGIRKLELGPDGAYKREWTNHEIPQGPLFIFNSGIYGRLLHGFKFQMRPRLKRVVHRARTLASKPATRGFSFLSARTVLV